MARRVSSLDKTTIGIERDIGSQYDNVKIVATNIDKIIAVESSMGEVVLLNQNLDIVGTVAGSIKDVNTVAEGMGNIVTVIPSLDNIAAIVPHTANIDTTAANIADINALALNLQAVQQLLANIQEVITVEAVIDDVVTVSGNTANITIVADNVGDVGTVATNVDAVNTTSANIDSVNSVATNMDSILSAEENATTATTKAAEAAASAAEASTSEVNAAQSATASALSATESAASAQAALDSENAAAVSETNAKASEISALNAESNALASENQAEAHMIAAASSETNAKASELAAKASETASALSELAAATSASESAASATASATSATESATSAANALTSENNSKASELSAEQDRLAAEAAKDAASISATEAATSATASATSADESAASATDSASSATAAATSEANAALSENNAAASASSAAISANASEASAQASAASYDDFDDRYLGAKAEDPTTDNDGDPLVEGALYFNTEGKSMRVFNGVQWTTTLSYVEGIKTNLYFLASAGQTEFFGADVNGAELFIIDPLLVNLYLNGVRLYKTEYTIDEDGNKITLATPANDQDEVFVEIFGNLKTQSGAFVKIGSGSIDSTVIGGTSPAEGTFTGLTADSITLGGGDLQTQLDALEASSSGAADTLTASVDQLTTDLSTTNSTLSNLSTVVDNTNADLSSLTARVATNEQDIDALETGLATSNTGITNLTNALATTDSEVDSLSTGLAAADTKISALETGVGTLTTDLDALEATVADNTTSVQAQLDNLSTAVDQAAAQTAAHEHDAAEVTSGTFVDARLPEGSVPSRAVVLTESDHLDSITAPMFAYREFGSIAQPPAGLEKTSDYYGASEISLDQIQTTVLPGADVNAPQTLFQVMLWELESVDAQSSFQQNGDVVAVSPTTGSVVKVGSMRYDNTNATLTFNRRYGAGLPATGADQPIYLKVGFSGEAYMYLGMGEVMDAMYIKSYHPSIFTNTQYYFTSTQVENEEVPASGNGGIPNGYPVDEPGALLVKKSGAGVAQMFVSSTSGRTYFRHFDTVFSPWVASALTTDPAGDAATLEGRPASSFSSEGHTHDSRYYTKTFLDSQFDVIGLEMEDLITQVTSNTNNIASTTAAIAAAESRANDFSRDASNITTGNLRDSVLPIGSGVTADNTRLGSVNLDTVFDIGWYTANGSLVSRGYPEDGVIGSLVVSGIDGVGAAQTLTSHKGLWARTRVYNDIDGFLDAWNPWQRLDATGVPEAGILQSGDDIYQLSDGTWILDDYTIIADVLNRADDLMGVYTITTAPSGYVKSAYAQLDSGAAFVNNYSEGMWSGWKRLLDKDSLPSATTSAKGVVQLSTSTTSTSTTTAATSSAVKAVRDIANSKLNATAKAADSDKLDGLDSSQFVRSDTSDTMQGNLTVDNGTNTTLTVRCDDAGNAHIRAIGSGQGTGVVEVGQSETIGGGISYNGDGTPSLVNGETPDHVTFFRNSYGSRHRVFSYRVGSDTVDFAVTPTVGGVPLVKTKESETVTLEGSGAERLVLHNTTNGGGVGISFSDNSGSGYGQQGFLKYVHANSESYGGGEAFVFEGRETQTNLVVNGGNLVATGDVIAFYSDERLKTFLGKIDSPLEKIEQLNGYYYVENEVAKSLGFGKDSVQVGVSAQEVAKVLPEVVTTAPISYRDDVKEEYLTVQYDKIVPLLIEAVKELKAENKELRARLDAVEAREGKN